MNVDNQDAHKKEGQDTVHACIGRVSTARIACEVSSAVKLPAAGTHRSDLVTSQ